MTPNQAKTLDLIFPVDGVDVSCAYDRQPGGTTPAGVNVRGYETLTNRDRGGSRSGLSPYMQLIPGGGLIQCLNIIVDPTAPALPGQDDDPTPGAIDDPSSDGSGDPYDGSGGNGGRNPLRPATGRRRQIRPGGTGKRRSRQRNYPLIPITITPVANGKIFGDNFVFDGDSSQWSLVSGRYTGGAITHVELASLGTPPPAPIGDYDITIGGATGPGASGYLITYRTAVKGFTVVGS